MFKRMMDSMDENDEMKKYLEQQTREAEVEQKKYERQQQKEKERKIAAMEAEKEAKLQELEERQARMFNWEDQVKASEDALMEGFRKQKEEMMAKKLADQQKEILKDMNKADVDALLDKHKRQLMQMDSTLKQEQERQLKMMREKMLGKGRKAAQDKIMRQIKMAEIQKKKTEEMQKAQMMVSQQQRSAAQEERQDNFERLLEKTLLMETLIPKQAYSRPTYFKRHLINQQKINDFLGRGLFTQDDEDQMDAEADSVLSLPSERLRELLGTQNVTYKLLLEHLQAADDNYHALREQHESGRLAMPQGNQLDRRGTETNSQTSNHPRRRPSQFDN